MCRLFGPCADSLTADIITQLLKQVKFAIFNWPNLLAHLISWKYYFRINKNKTSGSLSASTLSAVYIPKCEFISRYIRLGCARNRKETNKRPYMMKNTRGICLSRSICARVFNEKCSDPRVHMRMMNGHVLCLHIRL